MTSGEIKEYGLSIGYSGVGVTSADGFPGYLAKVAARSELFDFFSFTTTNPVEGALPRKFMPNAKSVIVLVLDYFQSDFPETLKAMIGKIYLARCYGPPLGTLNHSRLQLMKDFLSSRGCEVNAEIGVPARWAAVQAGVATFGKNNFAYADGAGSYIVIQTLVVDRELAYDAPTMDCACPSGCRACLDACPTRALYAPFSLDPRKCVSFNNWTRQDGRGDISSFIPYELREAIGGKIHGCDICQDVCPRNRRKLKAPKPMDRYIAAVSPDITLPAVLNMPEVFFQKRIRPVLYNYIKDKRYMMRNAALAIGNSQDEKYLPDLETALESRDEMIRGYAAWALGRIGGAAIRILERRLARETAGAVRAELRRALGD
ncbi:MAG: HEAT repeat domain-containing protein [Gracilibacteraceae bacterium]|jgi:epoxyqueuosine reductase|nr:HEAT repeat domain-containing protein [Gracilibacteraceae bacterium]